MDITGSNNTGIMPNGCIYFIAQKASGAPIAYATQADRETQATIFVPHGTWKNSLGKISQKFWAVSQRFSQ